MASISRFFQSSTELGDLVNQQLDALADDPQAEEFPRTNFDIWSDWPYSKSEVRIVEERWHELLASGATFEDFLALLQHHGVVWISGNIFFCLPDYSGMHHLSMVTYIGTLLVEYNEAKDDPEDCDQVLVCSCAGLPATVTTDSPYERVFELLAQRRAQDMIIGGEREPAASVSVESLTLLLSQNHGDLTFEGFDFGTQAHCDVLASFRGSLGLNTCTLHDMGRSIFDQVAQELGPAALGFGFDQDVLQVDFQSMQNALCRTKRLAELRLFDPPTTKFTELTSGLKANKSLTTFALNPSPSTSEGQWAGLLRSLRTHPTLEELKLYPSYPLSPTERGQQMVQLSRAVAEMLKVNHILRKVDLKSGGDDDFGQPWAGIVEEILRTEIRPRLKDNRFRRRFQAIAAEPDASLKRSLVFAALCNDKIRGNPSLMKRLVSTFHELISQQYEDAKQSTASVPIAGRTRKRKRL